jgi:hypothetical protein
LGSLAHDFSYGYGGIISVEKWNLMFDNLCFGIGAGFVSFRGNGQNQGDLFPLLISTRYRYPFSERFAISGGFSLGPAYFGGKEAGVPFSRFTALGQLDVGVRARLGKNFELELSGLAGSLYRLGSVHFFAGGSLAAITVVEF